MSFEHNPASPEGQDGIFDADYWARTSIANTTGGYESPRADIVALPNAESLPRTKTVSEPTIQEDGFVTKARNFAERVLDSRAVAMGALAIRMTGTLLVAARPWQPKSDRG